MSSAQSNNPDSAERELESFRRQWQEEVRRGKRNPPHQDYDQQEQREARITDLDLNAQRRNVGLKPPTGGNTGLPPEEDDPNDGAAFHDLPSKDDALRLASDESMRKAATITSEPTNALDHYEKAVERETAGSLGDSVTLYRKAFRVCNCPDILSKRQSCPLQIDSLMPTCMKHTKRSTFRRLPRQHLTQLQSPTLPMRRSRFLIPPTTHYPTRRGRPYPLLLPPSTNY